MAGAATPTGESTKGNALVVTGLLLGILLFAIDQTVVGTSLPTIVADLGESEKFPWLFTAYMLASTVVVPLAGKASDILGRRPVYLAGMITFLAGSILCGTATSMTQLVLYRGLQGLGGGAIFPVALATIADLYPPSERGKVQGLFGAVFGLSSVLGPLIGGWIVDNMHVGGIDSWRWAFYVNVPIAAVAITMVAVHFPRRTSRPATRIDYAGVVTLTTTLVAGLLVLVWGGDTYAWTSPLILGLTALTVVALALFVLAERRAADPIVPPLLFREPVFVLSAVATLLMGVGMFGVISFLPTYMQGVVGLSATYAGLVLTPLSLALVAGSITSGRLMARFGYKKFMIAGTIITAIGFLMLQRLTAAPSIPMAVLDMIVVGLGIGFTIQTFIVATQNVVARTNVGAATSSITLARSLGATLGVTVLGVLLNRRLASEIPARVPADALAGILANPFIAGKAERVPSLLLQPQAVAAMPPAVVQAIKDALSASIGVVFIGGMIIAVGALAFTAFIRDVPLKDTHDDAAPAVAAE